MSGWNIDFDRRVAERIHESVLRGKHLKGFEEAEHKLGLLKNGLEKILFDAEWYGDKCDSAARRYDHMQKSLANDPNDFSESHAREVCAKSPETLYGYTDALKSGAVRLREAIAFVDELAKRLENAKLDAEGEGKRVAGKILQAIELMDRYLHVDF